MKIFLTIVLFVLCSEHAAAQTSIAKITGRVYVKYQKATAQANTTSLYNSFISDIKVILVPSKVAGDVTEVQRNMSRFCGNDRQWIRRYNAKLVYTDRNGKFEFDGAMTNRTYFVIFCDSKMQMSEITTKGRGVTYELKDKQVIL